MAGGLVLVDAAVVAGVAGLGVLLILLLWTCSRTGNVFGKKYFPIM